MAAEWHFTGRIDPSDATRADRRVAALAAEQHGVLDVDELHACGLSEEQIKRRLRAGHLHRRHQAVYAVGHTALTQDAQFLAAVKAHGPEAWLSHHAATVHFALLAPSDRPPDVTVLGPTTRRHPGIRTHRTTHLDPRDRTRHRGVPTTAPARTLLDLAGTAIPDKGLRRAVHEAQAQRLTNVRDLVDVLNRHPGRRGATRLRTLVADGPAPTRSELEDIVLDLLLSAGLPKPDVNKPLHIHGRRLIPDFRWPKHHLILEADGGQWHDTPLAQADDAERQSFLEQHGERVVRARWNEAVRTPGRITDRLEAAGLYTACPTPSRFPSESRKNTARSPRPPFEG
jgi:predicted transcriptional regulator of viral defense system